MVLNLGLVASESASPSGLRWADMVRNQRCGPPGVKLAASGQSAGSFSGKVGLSQFPEKGLRVSIWVEC